MKLPPAFWKNVALCGDCWLWNAYLTGGYGKFFIGGRLRMAHRLAYEELRGPIPAGMNLDHLCRVRNCVNPDHLEAVTQRENVVRGALPAVTVARHASKTHCLRGHLYDDANTKWNNLGYRSCRECTQARARLKNKNLEGNTLVNG